MRITMISFKIASWTLLLGGILHTVSDLLSPETPERNAIISQMKELTGIALGTEFNMYSFFQGFSLTMGLLLFGFGALNILILKNNQGAHLPSNILVLNIIVSLIALTISLNYFFIIPIILTGIPFLGYLISFVTRKKI